jgi:hypothetical protein
LQTRAATTSTSTRPDLLSTVFPPVGDVSVEPDPIVDSAG